MSAVEDTTESKCPPTPVSDIVVDVVVDAVVKDLESTISNTLETPLRQIDETTKLVEEMAQLVLDETTKSVESKIESVISEGEAIVDETTKLVEDTIQSVENVTAVISEEEKRITETITRLSISMEQEPKKAATLMTRFKNFVKLILSCTHTKDKSVDVLAKVGTADVEVSVNADKPV